MPQPTIRDVAREAGVGLGTVSRVLARNPHVATSTRERVTATIERLGYRDALSNAGIDHRPQYEQPADWSAGGGAAALDALLGLPDPPSAIVAGSDTQAIGILDRARQRGLIVPGDLAVCGYGDIELAHYLGLTTVRVPMRMIGERAVSMLLEAIEGPRNQSEHVLLPVEVVVRTTCGAPGGHP